MATRVKDFEQTKAEQVYFKINTLQYMFASHIHKHISTYM